MRDPETINHILCDDPAPCWHCGEPTQWVELSFETPLHPGSCSDAKWREFEQANAERVDAEAERQGDIPAGTRTTEHGMTMEWTGSMWRHVTRAELETEARRGE